MDHGGNIQGFSSLVSLMPDVGIGVVVLSNTLNLAGYAISRNAYDRLLGQEPRDWSGELLELYAMFDAARAQAALLWASDAIPTFRLDEASIREDIDAILGLGADIQYRAQIDRQR